MSNSTVELDGTEGVLKMDYRDKELNIVSGAEPVWVEGTQVAAADFVDALGNYEAGDPTDPVTVTLEVASTCDDANGDGDSGDGDSGDVDDRGGIFGSLGILFGSLGA